MNSRRTTSKAIEVSQLSSEDHLHMFNILSEHFLNLQFDVFEKDLREKDWVVTVNDAAGKIIGFSTLKVLSQEIEGEKIYAFYSGDTVLSKSFTGDPTWIPTWGEHVFAQAALLAPAKSYWLLLTATHRTYRILPTCFKEFIPNPKAPPNPHLKKIMDNFVLQKFPDEYDPETGVVVLKNPIPYSDAERVKARVGGHHFYTNYFREINPMYLRGDFLCCLTEIKPENLNPRGSRIVYDIRPVVAIS